MEDTTTIVEFNIEPLELFEITQDWATETKFSVHEKNEKRTLYSKNIRGTTAWLSIENQGENAKLNAWLAPRGLGPDAKGNAWKGWKTAIPNGFAIGPVSIYKKQFDKLMEMLESKSKNITRRSSAQKKGEDRPKIEKGVLVKGLAGIGAIQILLGVLNITSSSIYISSYPGLGYITLYNGILSVVLGVLALISSRMLRNGSTASIWLYGASILLNIIYNIVMGHKLPYFSVFAGAFIIWQLWTFKREGKLA